MPAALQDLQPARSTVTATAPLQASDVEEADVDPYSFDPDYAAQADATGAFSVPVGAGPEGAAAPGNSRQDPGGAQAATAQLAAISVAPAAAAGFHHVGPTAKELRKAQRRLEHATTQLSKFPRYRANDYAVEESDLRRSLILTTRNAQFRAEAAFAWALSGVIGVVNGLAGFTFNYGIYILNKAKFDATKAFIRHGGGFIVPYCVYISFAVLYGLTASVLGSYVSPQAAGSGIPEIRCYLNGIHVRGLLTIRTFFAKAFGVCFSVASGLVVGKEGPFTHVGAIIGGGVAGLGSTTLTRATNGHWRAVMRTRFGRYFRSAVSHRDYVAAGAAAGVSSAFGAPVGGILFSVEQGSSFYSATMLLHAFLAAGVAMYVSLLLTTAIWRGAETYRAAFTSPQQFTLIDEVPVKARFWYYLWELPVFLAMGVGGGLAGAAMVWLNQRVTNLRKRFVPSTQPSRRVVEVVLLAAVTSSVWLLLCYVSPCGTVPENASPFIGGAVQGPREGPPSGVDRDSPLLYTNIFPQLWCPPGKYSHFGQLFFVPQATAITLLFQYQLDDGSQYHFEVGALVLLAALGWFFMSITFGSGTVTGLFVPSLLVGSSGGRLVGRAVEAVVRRVALRNVVISLQSYAVVGAASVLGGVSRMLLCNTVLVMETAGAHSLTVPLIAATFVAKIVADLLNRSIFDLAIERAGYPYLPAEPRELDDIKLQQALTAGDVMSSQLVTLPVVVRIRDLVEVLRRYPNFSTFPLTDNPVGPPAAAGPTQPPAQLPTATGVTNNGGARRPSSLGPPSASRNTSRTVGGASPVAGTASTTSFLYTPSRSNEDITSQGGASMAPSGPSAVPHLNGSANCWQNDPTATTAVNDSESAAAQAAAPGTLPYQPYGTPAVPCSRMTYMSAFAAPPASVRWPNMAAIQLSQPPSHGSAGLSGQHPLQTLHEHDLTYSGLLGQPSRPRPGSRLQTSSTPLVTRRSVPTAAEPRDPGLAPLPVERTISGRRSEDHVGRPLHPPRTLPPLPSLPRRASAGGGGGGGVTLPTPSMQAWDPAAGDPAARTLPSRQAGPCAEGTEGPAGADGQAIDAAVLGGANGNGSVAVRRASDGTGRLLPSASVSRRTTADEGHRDQGAPCPDRVSGGGGGSSAAAGAGGAAPGVGVIVGIIGRPTLLKLLEVRRDIGNMAATAAAEAAAGRGTGSGGGVSSAAATAAASWGQQQQHADRDGGACTATGVQTGPWWNPLAQLRSRGRHGAGSTGATAPAASGAHPTAATGTHPTASRTRTRSSIPSFTFSFSFSLWSKDHASRKPAAAIATPTGPAATAASPATKRDGGGTANGLSRVSSGGSEPTTWLRSRQPPMSRGSAIKLLDAVDPYPAKAPADRPGEEALFASLEGGPGDHMDALLDLRHYMQRVPYVVPTTASLARTYRLFRDLGLHHILVTPPSIPVVGLITRTDISTPNAYKVAYNLAQQELAQMQEQAAIAAAAARAAATPAVRGSASAIGRDRDTLGLVEEEDGSAASADAASESELDAAAVQGDSLRPSPAAPSVPISPQPTTTTDGGGRSPPSRTPRRSPSPAPLLRPSPVRPHHPTLPAAAASGPFSPASLDTHLTSPIAPAAQPSGTPLSPDRLAEPPAAHIPSAFAASGQLFATALEQQQANAMAWRPLAAGPLGLQDRLPVTSPRPGGDREQQQQQQHREHFHDADQAGRHVSLPGGSPGPGSQPPYSTGLRRRPRASTSFSATSQPGEVHGPRTSPSRPLWSPTPDTPRRLDPADARARQHAGLQPQHQPDTNMPLSVPFSVLVFGSGMFKAPGASAELERGLPCSDARPRAASQNQPRAVTRARLSAPITRGAAQEHTSPAAGAASTPFASAGAVTTSPPAQQEAGFNTHAAGGPGGDAAAAAAAPRPASGPQGVALPPLQLAVEGLRGLLRSAVGSVTGELRHPDSGAAEHLCQQQGPEGPGTRREGEDDGKREVAAGGDGHEGVYAATPVHTGMELSTAEAGAAQRAAGVAGESGAAMVGEQEQPGCWGAGGEGVEPDGGEHLGGVRPRSQPIAPADGVMDGAGGDSVGCPALHVQQQAMPPVPLAMPPVPLAEDLLFATVMMDAPPAPGEQQVPSAAAYDGGAGVGADGEGVSVDGVEGAVAQRRGPGPTSGAGPVHGEEGEAEMGTGAVRGVFQRAVGWMSSAVGARQVVREAVEEEGEEGETGDGEGGLGIV